MSPDEAFRLCKKTLPKSYVETTKSDENQAFFHLNKIFLYAISEPINSIHYQYMGLFGF